MFKTIIEPRVSETDGVGHINNTIVPVWLEAGRNKIFKLFNPDYSFDNWKMIILNTNIDYVHQIYYGENAEIRTGIKKLGNTSLQLYEEIWQNNMLCVKATTIYVNYNLHKQISEPLPKIIRTELEKHMHNV